MMRTIARDIIIPVITVADNAGELRIVAFRIVLIPWNTVLELLMVTDAVENVEEG